MRADETAKDPKAAMNATYRFLSSIAGDLPQYEDALRALYASDKQAFAAKTSGWPKDVRGFANRLAGFG